MNIYVLSPLKIPFPSMAFTPKYVQMTSLPFLHHCLKFHQHLIFNMLRIELTPIPSHPIILYTPPPPQQVGISTTVVPYLSVCICFSFFCVKIITNSQWHTIHTFTSHLRSTVQQAVSTSNCGLRSGLFHEFHSGAQTEEAVATWGMFFSWR